MKEEKPRFKQFYENIFGTKVEGTRIFPVSTKIILLFVIFILASNLTTNYINLIQNRKELLVQQKKLLVKDLKQLYRFVDNEHSIYKFNHDLEGSVKSIENKSKYDFSGGDIITLGIKDDGSLLFQVAPESDIDKKMASEQMVKLVQAIKHHSINGVSNVLFEIEYGDIKYLAVFKFNPKWKVTVLIAKKLKSFYARSRSIFIRVTIISLLVTLVSAIVGILLLKHILRFVRQITDSIMAMSKTQEMSLVPLEGAVNDDVTFLGVAFNSLSSTIDNMVQIFKKFVNRDVANKAYIEKNVKLEGSRRELTCLFSDIRSFTNMTETLGSDIITLLNIHYDRAISEILKHDGVIGAIIGDALLAVYGAIEESVENKSYQSLMSAYKIQYVAESLRDRLKQKKKDIESKSGKFSKHEMQVYKAVLIEVGVGIDGGNVFYGNIGSNQRMTNTVIGDTVNSSSRLEGLTRIYQVPVICSQYVKEDIEDNLHNHGVMFLELDEVKVKGKSIGKKIYWPILESEMTPVKKKNCKIFSEALKLYYKGDWRKANAKFKSCRLPMVELFIKRTDGLCPKGWDGIWTMKTK